jgi:hypothetical protein
MAQGLRRKQEFAAKVAPTKDGFCRRDFSPELSAFDGTRPPRQDECRNEFRLMHWLQRGPNSIVKIHLSRRKKDVFRSAQADRWPKALRRLKSASQGAAR